MINKENEELERKIEYDSLNEPLTISREIMDKILKEEECIYILAVYLFLYYTAKWQKTSNVKATNSYIMKGLGIGKDRFIKTKKTMIDLGLISVINRRDETGSFSGWYVHVNTTNIRRLARGPETHLVGKPPSGFGDLPPLEENDPEVLKPTQWVSPPSGFQDHKCLTTFNKNAKEQITKIPSACAEDRVSDSTPLVEDVAPPDLQEPDLQELNLKETEMKESNLKEKRLPKYQWVVDYWNSYTNSKNLGIQDMSAIKNKLALNRLLPECRKITPDLQNVISKIRLKYSEEDVKMGIQKYIIDILSRSITSEYCDHRFSCFEFFKQGNGFPRFINK